jgi:hypothetical protein
MPIVEAQPKRDTLSKGTRPLFRICFDRAADMLDTLNSSEAFAALDWKLQQDLLTHFSGERRKKRDLEHQITLARESIPLANWEKFIELGSNATFIQTHKEDFTDQIDVTNKPEQQQYWSDFLDSLNMLKSERVHDLAWNIDELFLHENSNDSVIRFSICTEKSRSLPGSCAHHEHFELQSLPACWMSACAV